MKRCVKGKSCSATCISRAKICRMDLLDTISDSLQKLVGFMREKFIDMVPPLRRRRDERIRIRENRRRSLEDLERTRVADLTNSQNFAKKIQSSLPKGMKATGNEEQVKVQGFTKSGHKVRMEITRSGNVSFDVNNSFAAGTVTDRKAQLEVAMTARGTFNAVVSNMKEGAKLITGAFQDDGLGSKREAAYQRLGFSAPDRDGVMAATVVKGKLVPDASMPKWEKNARLSRVLDGDFSEAPNQEVKDWLTAIFGVSA